MFVAARLFLYFEATLLSQIAERQPGTRSQILGLSWGELQPKGVWRKRESDSFYVLGPVDEARYGGLEVSALRNSGDFEPSGGLGLSKVHLKRRA